MKTLIYPVLALLLASGPLSAQATTSTNQWELFVSLDWPGRQAYLEKGSPVDWDDAFLTKALALTDEAQIETGEDREVSAKKAVAIRVVRALAARSVTAAAPALARLPVQYRDPWLRGEAWLAGAKLGDATIVPALVRTLSALNESSQRGRGEEIQATYVIQALGLLKATDGFRAVAAAGQAWYSPASGVRALAKKTLPQLTTDLNAAIDQLLASDEDLALVEGVFQDVVAAGDADRTARAAGSFLGPLVRVIPHDQEAQDRTYRLILAGLTAAQKVAKPPVTLVPALRFLVVKNNNDQEMIQSIQVLAKIDDPAALDVLVTLMNRYNAQQKVGTNTARDITLARETITALALTGKAGARKPLDEAQFCDYTPAVNRDLVDALAKLPRD